MPSMTFRLSPELHERFVVFCERRDLKPSEMLRQAVERLIDREDGAAVQTPPPPPGPRSHSAVVVQTKRQRVEVAAKQATHVSGVHVGPVRAAPGSRLKVK